MDSSNPGPIHRMADAIARRPATLSIGLALIGLIWGLGPGADSAGAARYAVAQCGWKAGHQASWYQYGTDRFQASTWCGVPEGSDPWDGIHVTSGTRYSARSVAGTRFARWRWQAPEGTSIASVSGDRWHALPEGFRHRLGQVTGGRFTHFLDFTTSDKVRRDFSRVFVPRVDAFESRLLCARPEDSSCRLDGTAVAGVRGLTFVLDDPSPPEPRLEGLPAAGTWVRGELELRFSGADEGSGLLDSQTTVDGSVVAETTHPCSKAMIAGQWRGTKLRPCELRASGTHRLDTARMGDRLHSLGHCARDFAGNRTCLDPVELGTDNNPPAAPRRLTVVGGEEWRSENGFELRWDLPDQGQAAPIAGARHRVSGPSGEVPTPGAVSTTSSITGISLPGPGEYPVSVWLVDQAGNADSEADSGAILRFDDRQPAATLVRPDPAAPDRLVATVSDAHSGVETGKIEVRHRSRPEWETLTTEFDPVSGRLVADFASDRRLPGEWLVRAVVTDRAGNTTLTDRLADDSTLVLDAPARAVTSIAARLSSAGREAQALSLPFGRGARVTGRLTGRGGAGLSGHRLTIVERPVGSDPGPSSIRSVSTGRLGTFSIGVGSASSRRISIHFAGTPGLAAATSNTLELRVNARIRFSARPRRLGNGEVVRFRGSLRPRLAALRSGRSPVEIQYLETGPGRWRPVLVTRVLPSGTFRAAYRFRYVTSTSRIRFRARLITAGGLPFAGGTSRPVTVTVRGG